MTKQQNQKKKLKKRIERNKTKKSHLLAIGFLRLFGCCANPRACALVPFSFKLIPTTFEELDASVGYSSYGKIATQLIGVSIAICLK